MSLFERGRLFDTSGEADAMQIVSVLARAGRESRCVEEGKPALPGYRQGESDSDWKRLRHCERDEERVPNDVRQLEVSISEIAIQPRRR